MIRIARPEEMDAVRELFREYAESIRHPVTEAIPGVYAPLLVADESNELVACAGLRGIGDEIGEMKRLYVRPVFRGRGLGRLLTERIIAEARSAGYRLLRLDTLPVMGSALALYRELGFREIPPYGDNPPEAICFELPL